MGGFHGHFLDTYSHVDSPIHRLPAWAKLWGTVALILALVAVPPWMVPRPVLFVAAGFVLVMVAAASNVPGLYIAKRMIFLEPFVLGVAVLALFQPNGKVLFTILVARSTLCILAVVLLANTTPFSDLMRELKRVHMPPLLVTTVALMYRYLYVLKDEGDRMRTARASRTFTPARGRAWRSMATIIAQLFLRATDRAERIYHAMCSRGWT